MTDPELERHNEHLVDLLQQAEYLLKNSIPLLGGGHQQRVLQNTIKHWLVEWRGARLVYGVPLVEEKRDLTLEEEA